MLGVNKDWKRLDLFLLQPITTWWPRWFIFTSFFSQWNFDCIKLNLDTCISPYIRLINLISKRFTYNWSIRFIDFIKLKSVEKDSKHHTRSANLPVLLTCRWTLAAWPWEILVTAATELDPRPLCSSGPARSAAGESFHQCSAALGRSHLPLLPHLPFHHRSLDFTSFQIRNALKQHKSIDHVYPSSLIFRFIIVAWILNRSNTNYITTT